MHPKISLVTPSFNQGHFLEETIDSVLNQDYPNLEYIIIDGGSSDGTLEVIRKYQKYLSFWMSEPDHGQAHAIQKGINHSTGDIFNWLNSDDLLMSDSLSTIAEYFRQQENLLVLSGREIHFDQNQETLRYGTRLQQDLEMSVAFAAFYQPSTFWAFDTFKKIGLNTSLHYLMDTDLWIRFLLNHGIEGFQKIKEPIARFRLHEQSKSVSQQSGFFKERWQIRNKLLADICGGKDMENIIHAIAPTPPIEDVSFEGKLLDRSRLKYLIYQQLLIDLTDRGKISEAREVFYDGLMNGFWNKSFIRTGIRSQFPFLKKGGG